MLGFRGSRSSPGIAPPPLRAPHHCGHAAAWCRSQCHPAGIARQPTARSGVTSGTFRTRRWQQSTGEYSISDLAELSRCPGPPPIAPSSASRPPFSHEETPPQSDVGHSVDPLFFGLLDQRVQMDPNLAQILHMQLYRKVIDAGQLRPDRQ